MLLGLFAHVCPLGLFHGLPKSTPRNEALCWDWNEMTTLYLIDSDSNLDQWKGQNPPPPPENQTQCVQRNHQEPCALGCAAWSLVWFHPNVVNPEPSGDDPCDQFVVILGMIHYIHYWLYHITIHYSFWIDLLLNRHENPTLSARLKTQCAQKTLPKGKRDLGFDSLIDSSGFHGKVSGGIEWDALMFLWFRMFRESCFLSETKPIFTYIWNRPGEEHELPEHTARQCKSMSGYEWNIHPFGQSCRQKIITPQRPLWPHGPPWDPAPAPKHQREDPALTGASSGRCVGWPGYMGYLWISPIYRWISDVFALLFQFSIAKFAYWRIAKLEMPHVPQIWPGHWSIQPLEGSQLAMPTSSKALEAPMALGISTVGWWFASLLASSPCLFIT